MLYGSSQLKHETGKTNTNFNISQSQPPCGKKSVQVTGEFLDLLHLEKTRLTHALPHMNYPTCKATMFKGAITIYSSFYKQNLSYI